VGKWSIPIDKLAAKSKASIETVVRRSTYEVFRKVILSSPVDTGRFRANWNVSYQALDTATTESTSAGRAQIEVNKALTLPVGGVVYLTNGLPYARRLEYGYSSQAPAGMVRIAAAQFASAVNKAIP
jgi:Bacteriophage HK97-gp10, putative tail-component